MKKDEGVDVAVGGLAARTESLDRGRMRGLMAAVDERLRLVGVVAGMKKLEATARGEGAAMGRWLARRKPSLTVLADTMMRERRRMRVLLSCQLQKLLLGEVAGVVSELVFGAAKNRKNCSSSSR